MPCRKTRRHTTAAGRCRTDNVVGNLLVLAVVVVVVVAFRLCAGGGGGGIGAADAILAIMEVEGPVRKSWVAGQKETADRVFLFTSGTDGVC